MVVQFLWEVRGQDSIFQLWYLDNRWIIYKVQSAQLVWVRIHLCGKEFSWVKLSVRLVRSQFNGGYFSLNDPKVLKVFLERIFNFQRVFLLLSSFLLPPGTTVLSPCHPLLATTSSYHVLYLKWRHSHYLRY